MGELRDHAKEKEAEIDVAPFTRILLQELCWAMGIAAVGIAGSGFADENLIGFGLGAAIGYWGPFQRRQHLQVTMLPELPDRSRTASSQFTAIWTLFDAWIATSLALTLAGLFLEPFGSVFGGTGLGVVVLNLRTVWKVRRRESVSSARVFLLIRGRWYVIARRTVSTWYRKSWQTSTTR